MTRTVLACHKRPDTSPKGVLNEQFACRRHLLVMGEAEDGWGQSRPPFPFIRDAAAALCDGTARHHVCFRKPCTPVAWLQLRASIGALGYHLTAYLLVDDRCCLSALPTLYSRTAVNVDGEALFVWRSPAHIIPAPQHTPGYIPQLPYFGIHRALMSRISVFVVASG